MFTKSFAVLALAKYAYSFQDVAGNACSVVGHPCEWQYTNADTGAQVVAVGWCAPDHYCGDNGATCENDNNCYDYCGTDGICGGLGALCDTTAAFEHNQFDAACYTPAYTCSADGEVGECVAGASSGSSKKRHARTQAREFRKARDMCSAEGEELCLIGEDYQCVNTLSNIEFCGGCSGHGAVDCTTISGALEVECVAGSCVVGACLPGHELTGDLCVPN